MYATPTMTWGPLILKLSPRTVRLKPVAECNCHYQFLILQLRSVTARIQTPSSRMLLSFNTLSTFQMNVYNQNPGIYLLMEQTDLYTYNAQ